MHQRITLPVTTAFSGWRPTLPIARTCPTQQFSTRRTCDQQRPSSSLIHARQRQIFEHRLSAGSASSDSVISEDDIIRFATIGDIVQVHFTCKDEQGKVLESSRESGEPLVFEIGAGEVISNKLFKGFDEAVRGLAVGQTAEIAASGGEWRKDLLFAVPRDHPEIERMQARYKSQGGLVPGMVVELSNGSMAHVVEMTDAAVQLDANNMLAGKTLTLELELLAIDKADDFELLEEEEAAEERGAA